MTIPKPFPFLPAAFRNLLPFDSGPASQLSASSLCTPRRRGWKADNASSSAPPAQRGTGSQQRPRWLLSCPGSRPRSCMSLFIISVCKVPVALVTENNVDSLGHAKPPSGQGNKRFMAFPREPLLLGLGGKLRGRRNGAACYDHTVPAAVPSFTARGPPRGC